MQWYLLALRPVRKARRAESFCGDSLVLETKGQDTDQDKTKRAFLEIWIKAVNEHGGFGKWGWAVARKPGDVVGILDGNHKM
jgi:hypothetical protein